jgi:hypothetical protein
MATDLEMVVRDHLRAHPWLTAFEIARAVHRPSMGGVRYALDRMEAAGTAVHRERPRDDCDPRPRVEWRTVGE